MTTKHGFIGLLVAGIFFLTTPQVHASVEFNTTFINTYQIGRDGTATVKQDITLVNNLPNIYATEYEIDIGSTRIKNVTAMDTETATSIPVTVTVTDHKTQLHFNFQDKVVGRGKKRNFLVQYTNPDAAQKIGAVLEVTIPKLTNTAAVDAYQVILQVPSEFGPPTNISPPSFVQGTDRAYTTLTFNDVGAQSISAIFGTTQHYSLALRYNLQNPTITPTLIQVALPPDTAYQQLTYQDINPPPQSLTSDVDGNWIATFELEPKEQRTVAVTGTAAIYMTPTVPVPPTNPDNYLTEQPYWQVTNPIIKELAGKLQTPEAIYTYLVEHFTYNYARLDNQSTKRLGAATALEDPSNALCQEFTDAFVALARAANIPARALTGYAITENSQLRPLSLIQDVLHAWPEYYDANTKQWIPVDPTWGNTTGGIDYFHHLDFNHIVFAIQGTQSTKPNPVGYYKLDGQNSKDVAVTVSAAPAQEVGAVEPRLEFPASAKIGLQDSATLHLKNRSGRALYSPQLLLTTHGATLTSQINPNLPVLLPYQDVTMPLTFTKNRGSNEQQPTLTVGINGQETTLDLPQGIGGSQPFAAIAIAAGVVAAAGVLTVVLGSLLVPRRRR